MSVQLQMGSRDWGPPTLGGIIRRPIPHTGLGDRWLIRGLALLGHGQVGEVCRLEHVSPANDPFILALNHSTRREALLVPAILMLYRGGRLIHFMADWNYRLIPGIGLIYRRAQTITVTRKSARPPVLNRLKPLYIERLSVLDRSRAHLLGGRSVGIFLEGRVNRDHDRLLKGRCGAAYLSLQSGIPIIPAGIRLPQPEAGRGVPHAPLEIRIGSPLRPPSPTSLRVRIADLRVWHAAVMSEVGRLCGKEWISAKRSATMHDDSRITTRRAACDEDRRRVIEILRETYHREKHWVSDLEAQIPPRDLDRDDIAWFVVTIGDHAAGVLRVLYDPPYQQYLGYGLKILDPALQVEEFIRANRIAEVGRFAVKPEFRGQFMVAAALMRAATEAVVVRGYTHLVTDVFEDDPHTPYGFHTRVMGFCPVATHEAGELHCRSRRITLVLDINIAYARLKRQGHWLYRYLTSEWDELSHHRLARRPPPEAEQIAELLRRLPSPTGNRQEPAATVADAYSPG